MTSFEVTHTAIYFVKPQEEGQKNIALTFDDGPHGTLTPLLLDVLRDRNAKATFFVMGVKVAKHKAVLERAHAEGHEIANHVWDHPVLTKITRADVIDQLSRTNEALKETLGIIPKIMRPPYGNTNGKLNEFIQKKGNVSVVMWSLDTLDWLRPDPKKIVNFTVRKVKIGDIILCHDIHPGTIEVKPTTTITTFSLSMPVSIHLSDERRRCSSLFHMNYFHHLFVCLLDCYPWDGVNIKRTFHPIIQSSYL